MVNSLLVTVVTPSYSQLRRDHVVIPPCSQLSRDQVVTPPCSQLSRDHVVTPLCSQLSSSVFVFLPLFVIAEVFFHLQGPNTSFLGSLHNHEVHGHPKHGFDVGRHHLCLQIPFPPLCYSKEKASGSEENSIREDIEK